MNFRKLAASLLLFLSLMAGFALPSYAVRDTLTAQNPAPLLSGAPAADSFVLTWKTCDPTDKEEVVLTGNEVLLVWNTSADTDRAITITSVADPVLGRSADITYTCGFGKIQWIGPIIKQGFAQSPSGKLYFEGAHADLKFAVVKLKGAMVYR